MAAMPGPYTLSGDLAGLEVARGYDGFLRGDPEPVVIFAVFAVCGPTVQMAGRTLHRFRCEGPFPAVAMTVERSLPRCLLHLDRRAPRWLVLAAALEVDGGIDVQRAFGAMERHTNISIWASDLREFEARPLNAIAADPEWATPRAIQLLTDGETFGASCESDKWIGCASWWMEANEPPVSRRYRAPFLSEDKRNDWTAVVDFVC
jgi:hypothetical protein